MRKALIVLAAAGVLSAAGLGVAASAGPDTAASFAVPVDETVTNADGATLHLSGTLNADVISRRNHLLLRRHRRRRAAHAHRRAATYRRS